jgi:hypothetical protein
MTDGPRLMQVPDDSQTQKPDDLVDMPITILAQESRMSSDGYRVNHRWVIRHNDGTVGMYWAVGQWPPVQVSDWFRANPGRPLDCTLRKTKVPGSYMRDGSPMFRWELTQRYVTDTDNGQTSADQDMADQVPF